MKYLFLLIPVFLFILSYRNRVKYNKFKGTGKIPVIVKAQSHTKLYFMLGLTSVFVCLFVIFETV
jgi:hypothetical protein